MNTMLHVTKISCTVWTPSSNSDFRSWIRLLASGLYCEHLTDKCCWTFSVTAPVPLDWYLISSSRFVSSLLEEPEVVVIGAGQGPAGSIIHRLFINSQRVSSLSLSCSLWHCSPGVVISLAFCILSCEKTRYCNFWYIFHIGRFHLKFGIGSKIGDSSGGVTPLAGAETEIDFWIVRLKLGHLALHKTVKQHVATCIWNLAATLKYKLVSWQTLSHSC